MNKADEDAVQWGRENLIPKNVSNWPKRPITDIDYLVWKALGLYTTQPDRNLCTTTKCIFRRPFSSETQLFG